jgi:hypothetical protein
MSGAEVRQRMLEDVRRSVAARPFDEELEPAQLVDVGIEGRRARADTPQESREADRLGAIGSSAAH